MRRIVGLAAMLAVTAAGGASAFAAETDRLSATAAGQIAALQDIKRSLAPAERKLDSRLAVALRQHANQSATARMPRLTTGVSTGAAEVDVRSDSVDSDLVERLRDAGANVRHASKEYGTVRAAVPLSALAEVASWKDVERVDIASGAMTARGIRPAPPESKEARAERLERRMQAALTAQQGAIVSEGDKAHAADTARTRRRVTGVGVKMCALSDGVDSLAASQTAGELPAVDVLPGQAGDGDEGTAMLEILHDVAPNAELGFATAFTSDASFAENIRALRFQAGCDVIVDDVLYFNEHPFQDGPIAQSVNAVTADGALFFSSAGNEGNTIDGTAGNYEADFDHSGRQIGKFAGSAHDFNPGPGVQVFEPISPASSANIPVTLFWADPLGGSANDYDLYLLDANDNVVSFSQDVQNGDDDPYEILGTPLFGGSTLRLAVVQFRGEDRYFQLSALRSRFKDSADGLVAYATPGVTRGHSAAVNAFSTAAAPAFEPLPFDLEPGDPPNPSGPYPNPFTRTQQPERFTSDGPRRVFFDADGTPITPGNFSSTGGAVRQKPDITAADGVNTSLEDFAPFFGTSAAAPHAAAIAALVLSGNPGEGNALVREAFEATALDLTPAGVDGRTGRGIIRADRVLAYTGATPQPLVEAGELGVTVTTGDGDAFLEPGESATVAVPAISRGDATATGINVTVTDDDASTTITPRSQSYGNLAVGATRTRNFRLDLAEDYQNGKPVALAVRVAFAGALSPTTATRTIPTGEPGGPETGFAYTGPAVAIPDNNAAGASVQIPVTGFGYASKLRFSIDGTECSTTVGSTTVGIDHTFVGDLIGTLTAPGGGSAILFQRSGGGGNNMCQVVFDDAAETPFTSVSSGAAPFTGTWRPREPLASLLSGPVDGAWTFKVTDAANADTGSIRAVSLLFTGFVDA
jgi:subtilisin-like proprotein convertase family protein